MIFEKRQELRTQPQKTHLSVTPGTYLIMTHGTFEGRPFLSFKATENDAFMSFLVAFGKAAAMAKAAHGLIKVIRSN